MNSQNNINIIPKPTKVELSSNFIDLKSLKNIYLHNNSIEEINCAKLFQDFLSPITKLSNKIEEEIEKNGIIIKYDETKTFKPEEYLLQIKSNNTVVLHSSSTSGLFYGFQSFRQLCPPELEKYQIPKETTIPVCRIVDLPTFSYRGMHLDVSRHFFDVSFIKTYIDMIALHKMNVFHWHLTDDNGWRIEIKKYPDLIKKSAWRVDRTGQPWKKQSPILKNEESTYGGYYTQEEIREVVRYAAEKNIMVVPEIEMPGHTSEVFAAYPNLSCNNDTLPVQPGTYWPTIDIFCAGNDDVFSFLEDVLSEIVDLFPSPYIHIGGDEAEKKYWKTCVKCQNRIKSENLKDEEELQSYFIKRIETFILSKNKKLVGWDEILEGGLAKSATVMSWRGMAGGIEAANAGHEVIMCPTSHCYFDYYQASPNNSPVAFGGLVTLKKVYSFNPIPEKLQKENQKNIIGAQGNLWTEYVQTPERAQYRVLPRMTALSEVLWSGPGVNTYEDFFSRLKILENRFENLNWTVSPGSFTVEIDGRYNKETRSIEVSFKSEKPGEKIRFTVDGTNPNQTSKLYKKPFLINTTKNIIAGIFLKEKKVPIEYSKQSFVFHKAIGKRVEYHNKYNKKYPGNKNFSLVDGLKGTTDFTDGSWQGWKSNNLDLNIDLGEEKNINFIKCGFLEAHGSRIFLPTEVNVSFSKDGKLFSNTLTQKVSSGKENGAANQIEVVIENIKFSTRFIKIEAVNQKICPDWHSAKGGHCWLFSDEIIIE